MRGTFGASPGVDPVMTPTGPVPPHPYNAHPHAPSQTPYPPPHAPPHAHTHTHAMPPHAHPSAAWPAPPYRAAPGWVPPVVAKPPRPARAFAVRELAALGALVVITEVALFTRAGIDAGGFGLGVLFAAVPLVAAVAARRRRVSPALAGLGALLALVVLRCVWAPTGAVVMTGVGAVLAFALAMRRSHVHVPEVVSASLRTVALVPARVGAALRGLGRFGGRARLDRAVVLPVVVPAALCLAFLGVFALANPLVAHGLAQVGHTLGRFVVIPSAMRVFLGVLAFVGGAALLRPGLAKVRSAEASVAAGEGDAGSIAIARNALVALNVLFAGYNLLDAAFLWAGTPPPGTTTQIYAHEGAFWLSVALAMLTAVVGVFFRGALAHDARARVVRALAYAWAAQGLLLALGTYRRIAMHVAKSGLSDLRIVGILGTTLVATGLVLVVWKLRRTRTLGWLVRRQLDALVIASAVYVLMPTHLVSARVNVARIAAGEYRPLLHMFRQASRVESAAELLPLLDHPDKRVRQGVASLLLAEQEVLREHAATSGWQARDLATPRTLAALDAASPKMRALTAGVPPNRAREVLLEISKGANEDRSLEELLAIPSAEEDPEASIGKRSRY